MLSPQTPQLGKSNQDTIRQAITDIHQAYCTIDSKLKTIWTSDVCPHAYGCLHYILSVSKKLLINKFYGLTILADLFIVRNKTIFSWLYAAIKFEVFVTSQSHFT